MKQRKGFTLIELLIVVTIIAILAGAAVPYVQDYVDESRRARCKNDLEEIRNALVLYEMERRTTYSTTNIASLIGPFLTKAISDPWGGAYVVNDASSTVFSYGPDGQNLTGDEITTDYRPRQSVTKIFWWDTNVDGTVNVGDSIHLYVTRPGIAAAPTNADLFCSWMNNTLDLSAAGVWVSNSRVASFGFTNVFSPGSDTIIIRPLNTLRDRSNNTAVYMAKNDTLKVLAP